MGLSISFWLALILGFITRLLANVISFKRTKNKRKSKNVAKFCQLVIVTTTGIILALPTLDFIGISISAFYAGILIIDLLISDPIIRTLGRMKNAILNSKSIKSFVDWIKTSFNIDIDIKNNWIEKLRKEHPYLAIFLEAVIEVMNTILYKLIVKRLISLAITILKSIEGITKWLLDNVVEALMGDVLTEIMRWASNILITIPLFILERIQELLEIISNTLPSFSWHDLVRVINNK